MAPADPPSGNGPAGAAAPSGLTAYVRSDDLELVLGQAERLGGTILIRPAGVGNLLAIEVFTEPPSAPAETDGDEQAAS